MHNCNDANRAVNTSIEAEERRFTGDATNHIAKRRAGYNKDFAFRQALLGTSSTVNTEISLNRYSFFEMLEDELLPNTIEFGNRV